MIFLDNPVLQRELLVSLRKARAPIFLGAYLLLLACIVVRAWPASDEFDMLRPVAGRGLVETFFIGQFLAALALTPSLSAGAITGERERQSYEMLIASPLAPRAIVVGKVLTAVIYMMLLVVASVPIITVCLPLGGISIYEVAALYWTLLWSILLAGVVSVTISAHLRRTAAALVLSYLVLLPLLLLGALGWKSSGIDRSPTLLLGTMLGLPLVAGLICVMLIELSARRLLDTSDLGTEGREVIDPDYEAQHAVGMIIDREAFPDRLLAPAKRTDLMPDGVNPVYDKELRSELISQGTLMLRVVIQASLLIALPLMAACLFFQPEQAPWYVSYVILFNVLVGPVFAAGAVTGERERQTLDLLLATTLSSWQIVGGKLAASLRVSGMLTSFLLWPLVLAVAMTPYYWERLPTVAAFVLTIMIVSATTASIGLTASVLCRRTVAALLASYVALLVIFWATLLIWPAEMFDSAGNRVPFLTRLVLPGPLLAVFSLPLGRGSAQFANHWVPWLRFVVAYGLLDVALLSSATFWFRHRRRLGD